MCPLRSTGALCRHINVPIACKELKITPNGIICAKERLSLERKLTTHPASLSLDRYSSTTNGCFFFFCRYHVLFEMVVFVSVVIKTNQETLHNPFITNSTKSLSGCCSSAFAHALAINEYRSSPITPDLSSQHWNTLPSSTNLLCIRTFVFYSWGRWITPNFLYVCTYHLVSLSLAIQTLATVAWPWARCVFTYSTYDPI